MRNDKGCSLEFMLRCGIYDGGRAFSNRSNPYLMLYSAYELGVSAFSPARIAAGFGARMWRSPLNPMAESWFGRSTAAALDLFENAMRRYPKPEWGFDSISINSVDVPVEIEVAKRRDFCTLLHFKRDPAALKKARGASISKKPDPVVMIVAPLSGHYATLLRGTVLAMLQEHDVYITDWADARDIPVHAGRFDLNSYIDYLIDFIRELAPLSPGGRAHTMAVCQPGPALLSAAAIMAEDKDPARPASMTIMGSPIDTRRSPTAPNILSGERSYEWFESNMISTVPAPYPGVMRRVYPGFIQLYSFVSMNSDRHLNAHYDYFQHLVEGDGDSADKHRTFYDEYLAVLARLLLGPEIANLFPRGSIRTLNVFSISARLASWAPARSLTKSLLSKSIWSVVPAFFTAPVPLDFVLRFVLNDEFNCPSFVFQVPAELPDG